MTTGTTAHGREWTATIAMRRGVRIVHVTVKGADGYGVDAQWDYGPRRSNPVRPTRETFQAFADEAERRFEKDIAPKPAKLPASFCAEYEGCTPDHCCYEGDEWCEHDRLRRAAAEAGEG